MTVSQAAARVYAKALFDIAVDGGSTEQVAEELHAVRAAIDGLEPQLRGFFEMPHVRREDKQRVVTLAFEGKVGRPVLGLLHVLVEKRREPLLGAIVSEFDDLVDERAGRVQATVTSAQPLDAELADALRTTLERQMQRQVVLQQRVNPDLLGGVRVSIGDLVIDGTLRRRLADMRRVLGATQS